MVKRTARLLFSLLRFAATLLFFAAAPLFFAAAPLGPGGCEAFADEPTLAEEGFIVVASPESGDEPVAQANGEQARNDAPTPAEEPQAVAVATDEEDQADARAVAEQLLELQRQQGGSIVPPARSWSFDSSNRPESSLAPVPQRRGPAAPQGWSHPNQAGEANAGWNGRNIWEFRLQQPRGNVWPAQQAAWNQPPDRRDPSPAEVLRDSAWQLEVTAQRLEMGKFYEQADAVRQAAAHLRLESRKQAKRDSADSDNEQHVEHFQNDPPKKTTEEKPQQPEKHNLPNRDKRFWESPTR